MRGSVAPMAKDLATRWQGVYVRHQKHCPAATGGRCACTPGYMARVWDRSQAKQLRSPTFRSPAAARSWRGDTVDKLARGELPDIRTELRVGQAVVKFIAAADEGKVLTKYGKRYKPSAVRDLESALVVHVVPALGARRLSDVRRGDVQRLVDDLTGLSGSRVRTVVNALRSMYRWAQDRDFVGHDPAALARLPAMNPTPRDRVAAPEELEVLLGALAVQDAVPYALAGFATARRQELRLARWRDIDFDVAAIELCDDETGRKSEAAWRVVPLLRPLMAMLRAEYLRQGRPAPDALVCPPRRGGRSGLLSCEALAERALTAWGWVRDDDGQLISGRRDEDGKIVRTDTALTPIGLHEARHSAASWMNAAGVNPKVASYLMGHSTPERRAAAAAGAAPITLSRYTHVLPGDLERAREQLDEYVTSRLAIGRQGASGAGS